MPQYRKNKINRPQEYDRDLESIYDTPRKSAQANKALRRPATRDPHLLYPDSYSLSVVLPYVDRQTEPNDHSERYAVIGQIVKWWFIMLAPILEDKKNYQSWKKLPRKSSQNFHVPVHGTRSPLSRKGNL
ncbi:unnamed protein product [Leptidea sinapis]|uniref:Uncharacterized protein n=1 Tax=Leptidea sinapis TaxID=189913 RepID=A0A5E4Q4C1_9NEOP|nr:unnamed protein product [Leptidea sinapis]